MLKKSQKSMKIHSLKIFLIMEDFKLVVGHPLLQAWNLNMKFPNHSNHPILNYQKFLLAPFGNLSAMDPKNQPAREKISSMPSRLHQISKCLILHYLKICQSNPRGTRGVDPIIRYFSLLYCLLRLFLDQMNLVMGCLRNP